MQQLTSLVVLGLLGSLVLVYGMTGNATYFAKEGNSMVCQGQFVDTSYSAAISSSYFKPPHPLKPQESTPICRRSALVVDLSSGKSVHVLIHDICGCKPEDIALSPSAYRYLRDSGNGSFRVQWDFVN